MKRSGGKLFIAVAAFVGLLSALPAARADLLTDDPLHGVCFQAAPQCKDNGSFTPINTNTTDPFGFTASSGPLTGTFQLDFLLPNLPAAGLPASIVLNGVSGTGAPATVTLKPLAGTWNSGDLATFVGFNTNNTNPANAIGAFLPFTQALDSSATGYIVYTTQVSAGGSGDISNLTLQPPSCSTQTTCGPLFKLTASLSPGSYGVGFLSVGNDVIATAPSGALLFNGGTIPPHPIPEPAAWTVLATGLAGLIVLRRRRRA